MKECVRRNIRKIVRKAKEDEEEEGQKKDEDILGELSKRKRTEGGTSEGNGKKIQKGSKKKTKEKEEITVQTSERQVKYTNEPSMSTVVSFSFNCLGICSEYARAREPYGIFESYTNQQNPMW